MSGLPKPSAAGRRAQPMGAAEATPPQRASATRTASTSNPPRVSSTQRNPASKKSTPCTARAAVLPSAAAAAPTPAASRGRCIHPAVAAAVSPVAVLRAFVPHRVVSHRLLEYLGPRFLPRKAVDVTVLGTAEASRLLGDLTATAAELSAIATKATRIHGALTATSVCHRDLPTVRSVCGAYLTVLHLDVLPDFHLDRVPLKTQQADAVSRSAAAFSQMRHLRELSITGSYHDAAFDAVITCVLAVLPTLRSLSISNELFWRPIHLVRLAVPNTLTSLSLRTSFRFESEVLDFFTKPAYGLWRFFSSLTTLTMTGMLALSPAFVEGMAAALTSLVHLTLRVPSCLTAKFAEALAAFPEGLQTFNVHGIDFPPPLSAYPCLTSVSHSSPEASLGDITAEGCTSPAAFKVRSRRRWAVRERAVRAAIATPISEFDQVDVDESHVPPPTLIDLSAGNRPKRFYEASSLHSLEVPRMLPTDAGALQRCTKLQELRTSFCGLDTSIPEAVWASLRQLRVLRLCGRTVATISWSSLILPLRPLGGTLEDLDLPFVSDSAVAAVAVHLPRITTLRLLHIEPSITPLVRAAALIHAGAIRSKSSPSTGARVSADTAAAVLGPAALAPVLIKGNLLRRQPVPTSLELTPAAVDGALAVGAPRAFDQPRRVHTLVLGNWFDADAVPGVALLFPGLSVVECAGVMGDDMVYGVACLRPYWPHIVIRKLADP